MLPSVTGSPRQSARSASGEAVAMSKESPPQLHHISPPCSPKQDGKGNSLTHSVAQRLSRTFGTGRLSPARRPKESPIDVTQLQEQKIPFKSGRLFSIIPGRLSWCSHLSDNHTRRQIANYPDKFFFSDDHQELYEPFCADFGPLNLSVVHNFCAMMRSRMSDPRLKNMEIVYYSDNAVEIRTNTAFLLGCFLMVDCGKTPEQAWQPFSNIGPGKAQDGIPFETYHDATYCQKEYGLTILSCLKGLHKAMALGWYSVKGFDSADYLLLDDPSFADMHVLCPKFAAFKGPSKVKKKLMEGIFTFTPQHYGPLFKERGITSVVRLNEPIYDENVFVQMGMSHHDLYFDDCTEPSPDLLQRFFAIVEAEPGRVAVHCKAGLGRTGTLVALYWMKHFGMTAEECMGWIRIVRPGSVIGPQQQFLHRVEHLYRKGAEGSSGGEKVHPKSSMTAERSAQLGLEVAAAQNARAANRMGRGVAAAGKSNSNGDGAQLPPLKSR